MQIRELTIPGAWEIVPKLHPDGRGVFLEWFKQNQFAEATGRRLDLVQANMSVSAAGVIRGIHFAQFPPSQAKYVTCVRGAFLDIIVDVRVGSPTFGDWTSIQIDDVHRRGVFLSEGLGHAIVSLEDDSTVLYLCSEGYAPLREFGLNPFDPEIGVVWPTKTRLGDPLPRPRLSDKDDAALKLHEAARAGILPTWEEATAYAEILRSRSVRE